MKKIILSLICLFVVSVCAGVVCATSDVDNIVADDSTAPQDMFISPADLNTGDFDNSTADLDNGFESVSDANDGAVVDPNLDEYYKNLFISVPVEMDLGFSFDNQTGSEPGNGLLLENQTGSVHANSTNTTGNTTGNSTDNATHEAPHTLLATGNPVLVLLAVCGLIGCCGIFRRNK